MAEPRPLVGVHMVLTMCFLLFCRSSPTPVLPPSTLCIPRERDALLDFKAGLTGAGNILSSWRGADCCRWTGILCSNRTGHVVKLRINRIGGEIRPSLLTLRHLKQLGLSDNDFGGKPIPELIGAMESLTDLDISYSNFSGRVPPHLGNLTNLLSLVLTTDTDPCPYSPDLVWVSGLRKLQFLDLSYLDLSAAVDWVHAINMLPNLRYLELDYCGLQNTMPPPLHSNLTYLETLSLVSNSFNTSIGTNNLMWDLPSLHQLFLSDCGIHGPIPDAVGNLTSLQTLYLARNHFTGSVPLTFKKLKKLQWLELSENFINMDVRKLLHRLPSNELQRFSFDTNNLTGSLPARLAHFTRLTTISLNNNDLSGEIPVGIMELPTLTGLWLNSNNLHGTITEGHFTNVTTLQHLWISDNSLTVKVNSTWDPPFNLTSAGFSSCTLGPQFPAWLNQPTIATLDVSNSSIHDNIPAEFWTANENAVYLDMSKNRLVGILPTFSLISSLVILDVSSNQLVGPISTLPPNITYLNLSGNNLSGALPSFIEAPMLLALLLFSNSFSGTIPCSLIQSQQLMFLDLSNNLLNGTLLKCPQGSKTSNIILINLNGNNLSGAFPRFLQKCKDLTFLDLSYNKFSGSLPAWIGSKLSQLALLRLRSNMFSGGIPGQLTKMKGLQYLDIGCNNISGNIPESLGSLTAMTISPNESSNAFSLLFSITFAGNFDTTVAAYTDSLMVDIKGQQLEYTRGITYMVNIDFSCNSLTGQIPHEIGMLVALKNLNLSWNSLSDIMPQSIGELRALESFDLSHNELAGEIPTSLSALTSLTRLNLSYNNLTGRIPSGNQLRTLDDEASIYIGNPGLCGPPLTRNCSGTVISPLAPE